jgi:hypothetical protein
LGNANLSVYVNDIRLNITGQVNIDLATAKSLSAWRNLLKYQAFTTPQGFRTATLYCSSQCSGGCQLEGKDLPEIHPSRWRISAAGSVLTRRFDLQLAVPRPQ